MKRPDVHVARACERNALLARVEELFARERAERKEPIDVREADADIPVVSLSDGVVTLRPWSRDDAGFMAEAFADPAIRRYNGAHDRLGRPAPPLSIEDAEAT